jgi:hypothetical protein
MEDPLTVDQIKVEGPKELKTAEVTDPIEELARQRIWPTTSAVKAAKIRAAKATIEKRRQFERGGAATAQEKYDNLLAEYNELKELAKEDQVLRKKENPGTYNPLNSKDRKAERARIIEWNNDIIVVEAARKALPAAKAKLDRARITLKVTNGKVSSSNTPTPAPLLSAPVSGFYPPPSVQTETPQTPTVAAVVKAANAVVNTGSNQKKVAALLKSPEVIEAAQKLVNSLQPPRNTKYTNNQGRGYGTMVGGRITRKARKQRKSRSTKRR